MPRRLLLEDLPRIAAVSDPRVSPDGSRVAYVVESIDLEANQTRSAIWLAPFDGGEPRPVTAGERHDAAPRWSPDGARLAFVSDRAGSRDLYVLPLEGGEPRRLTCGAGKVEDPVWSPDGRRLAFVAPGAERRGDPVPQAEEDVRRRLLRVTRHRHKRDGEGFHGPAFKHLWVVDLEGGPAAQVTDGPWDDGQPSWSPDGRVLAFVSDRAPDRDWHFEGGALHVVDLASGATRRLTGEDGRARWPVWSPDGASLAYVGAPVADDASATDWHLWRVPAGGGQPEPLSQGLGRSVGLRPGGYLTPSRPAWRDDGWLYLVNTGGATHLWLIGHDGSLRQLTEGAHAASDFTADRDGRRCALLVSDAAAPPEVFAWDAERGPRPLSRANADLLGELALAAPERVAVERPGGLELEGWLLRPPATDGPVPLVLSVHGGPHNFFGHAWSFDHQLYAARGWAVLYVNPRGSGGYGERLASQVIADWGGEDFADLMAFVDAAIARADPPIDRARLAITGNSYGGYMTCWALTQTDRFAVGVAGACISNLVSFFGTSDIGASWGTRELGGMPHERREHYLARSPISHVASVRTPLLLYHGEADLRCPIEQSEQMFSALLRLGQAVELLRIPGESHGALSGGSPVHRVEARRVISEWLGRYLG